MFVTLCICCFSTAIKNDTERKFCYQQLPVTLKLIYTILQVKSNLFLGGGVMDLVVRESL